MLGATVTHTLTRYGAYSQMSWASERDIAKTNEKNNAQALPTKEQFRTTSVRASDKDGFNFTLLESSTSGHLDTNQSGVSLLLPSLFDKRRSHSLAREVVSVDARRPVRANLGSHRAPLSSSWHYSVFRATGQYTDDSYFNPIQDADDNCIISTEEMNFCTNVEFLWVKDLDLIPYNPKPTPPFPPAE